MLFRFLQWKCHGSNNQSIQYRYWKRDGTNHLFCWNSFRKFQLAELGNDTCTPFEADDNIKNSTLLRTHRKGCLRRRICTQSNCNNQQSFLIAQSWHSRLEYESANKPTTIWNPYWYEYQKNFWKPSKIFEESDSPGNNISKTFLLMTLFNKIFLWIYWVS